MGAERAGAQPALSFINQEEVSNHDSLRQTHTESSGSSPVGARYRRAPRPAADRAAAFTGRAGRSTGRHRSAAAFASGSASRNIGRGSRDGTGTAADSNRRRATATEP